MLRPHLGRVVAPGYRIRFVLAAIAIVPLVGATWFAVGETIAANAERERTRAVDAAVQELAALSELQARLLTELNWTAAVGGIAELGIDTALVVELTGIDVPSQVADSAARVDALVAELGLRDVRSDLDGIRAADDPTLEEIDAGYRAVEAAVGALADRRLDQVIADAAEVSDRGGLVTSVRVLEAATVASQAISAEFNHYFGAQLAAADLRATELQALAGQAALRAEALDAIARLADPGSGAARGLAVITGSEPAREFDAASARLLEDNVTGAASPEAMTGILADLDEAASVFEQSTATSQLYLDLVDAAGEDVLAASSAAGTAASERTQQAILALAALAISSIAIGIAARRAIGRPIHQLAAAARRIRDGDLHAGRVAESGPVEVREAARAINEASEHLALAERQALALAEGDLEHQSLTETSPGSLGASLQSAVRTLTASMQEREEFRRRMTHEATHDGLTQLPNRKASLTQLQRGVARTSRTGSQLAVLFIDLDGFKDVNDQQGHHAGDIVLRTVAQRLAAAVRDSDHVGRLGGDEFLVIAEPVADAEEAHRLAEELHATICAPIPVDDTMVSIGASIGMALPAGHDIAEELLRDADLAVYRAKELGRNRIELCDEELRAASAQRADLEQALRAALVDEQFVLHYQPIVDPKSDRCVGYEALIRWDRPGHGLVGPDDFIPFAERSDLIVHIDRWVIRAVARQIVTWDADRSMPAVPISVNVSGRHLASPQFIANVAGPLDEFGIDPSRIVLEITESALLEDLGSAAVKLQHLRNRGVRIAIDDFGTGYTSLAHLKSLPIDILKIDRSFTADDSAASLVQLIIDTGHLLGATVTAEGIETHEQAEALGAMGSDELQGYLYGRPRPAVDIGGVESRTDPVS